MHVLSAGYEKYKKKIITYTIKIEEVCLNKINPEAISVLAFAETEHFSGNVTFRYKTN